jgi:hypothetical protein
MQPPRQLAQQTASDTGPDTAPSQQQKWEDVYATKDPKTVSWFEAEARQSIDLLDKIAATPNNSLIDIGAGVSPLVPDLWARGWRDLAALDLSANALAISKAKLPEAESVQWIAADVREWHPKRRYDIWHDRAALHFLTCARDQARYHRTLLAALPVGGHAIIATFAPDGPKSCSGQQIEPYDAGQLMQFLGPRFTCRHNQRFSHFTPSGSEQRFSAVVAQRRS